MSNRLRVTKDNIYSRRYSIVDFSLNGLRYNVTVYAECFHDEEVPNGHYYGLDLLFSVDNYADRRFLIGVSFGDHEMQKADVDKEVEDWIISQISLPDFAEDVQEYLDEESKI